MVVPPHHYATHRTNLVLDAYEDPDLNFGFCWLSARQPSLQIMCRDFHPQPYELQYSRLLNACSFRGIYMTLYGLQFRLDDSNKWVAAVM